jgi:hypothetical protein
VLVDNLPASLPASRFAEAARTLGAAARSAGLEVPAFRCPPRIAGAARTIRRYPGGTVVSVSIRGRPFEHALADMVEGVLVANRIDTAARPDLRALLHEALAPAAAAHGVAQAA